MLEDGPPGAAESAHRFYKRLAEDYDTLIRQLVPRYDELVEVVTTELERAGPRSVVDVGCGVGSLAEAVLLRLPEARLTAVDASPAMVGRARDRLRRFGPRARVVQADARRFQPAGPVDAVCSTLVLHNLPPDERDDAVRAIASWLPRDGVFVWGEFLRFDDPERQAQVVDYRTRFSLASGCPRELIAWNYRKEAEDDHPPTSPEILASGRAAGFDDVARIWAHDAFGVFRMRRLRA
ncbi:MAG: methyltransferase domain-containing protein [Gemmatimonadota bacterium]|jgi:ubiquinone/menaquinone biosynthesis C-methylase UbiE